MISKDIAISTPSTIKSYDNYLKDYVNISGFQWDSNCLDVVFTNLGNNITKYIQKVGDYNTVAVPPPQYIPPRSYQEKDYSAKCPENWTGTDHTYWNWKWTTCKNLDYSGPCNNVAGRTIKTQIPASCPRKIFGDPANYQQQSVYWSNRWFPGWRNRSNNRPNNTHYVGWNGPTDASQGDFSNTNIGRKNQNEGSYCTAGWAAQNSIGGAQIDCTVSGG
jgi:hypothetical protein